MHPYFSLQGRTALVTGGTRGIGKMIAKAYVEAGATVFVCARDTEACQQTADELSAFGTCHAVAANLATEEGVLQLATRLGEQISHLDILVNNAGTTWGAPLESYPVKGWEKVMQLNVTSVFTAFSSSCRCCARPVQKPIRRGSSILARWRGFLPSANRLMPTGRVKRPYINCRGFWRENW